MAGVVPKTIVIQMPSRAAGPVMGEAVVADCFLEDASRKRRRLTHLSPEQRMMRRKLKNRVAAQTARDRKKCRMTELEEAVSALEQENNRLEMENLNLRDKTSSLNQENLSLRERLGLDSQVAGDGGQCTKLGSCESAVLHVPQQQDQILALYTVTTSYLALLMTLSLACSFTLLNKTERSTSTPPPSRQTQTQPLNLSLRPDPSEKWWGPQQQSWNPSMN